MKQRNVGIHLQQGGFNVIPAMDGSTVCVLVSSSKMLMLVNSNAQLALKSISLSNRSNIIFDFSLIPDANICVFVLFDGILCLILSLFLLS